MHILADFTFYAALAFLITHEIDAVERHEWRLLPVLKGLKDETGFKLFTVLHVPVLMLMFWLANYPSETVEFWYRTILGVFLVVHAGLHKLLENHERYEFRSLFSRSIIYAAALLGLIQLTLLLGFGEMGRA